jgi:hypothetical protein
VRHGDPAALLPSTKDDETGEEFEQHTVPNVYAEMLIQICMDYPALPDPRDLTMTEIRFFYDGLRESLKKRTSPLST